MTLTWTQPLFLAATALAVVPLLLHLLARLRRRVAVFPAVGLLVAGVSPQSRLRRLHRAVLLGLRSATLILLAAAMAGPVLRSDQPPNPATTDRGLLLLAVDRSLAMGAPADARTRLDLARESALRLLARKPPWMDAALLLPADDGQLDLIGPTSDTPALLAALADLTPAGDSLDLPEVLLRSRALAAAYPATLTIVLADRDESAWRTPSSADPAPVASPASAYVLPVSLPPPPAVAIDSLRATPLPAARGIPFELEALAVNRAASPRTAALEIRPADSADAPRTTTPRPATRPLALSAPLLIPPGESRTLRARITPPEAGTLLLQAALVIDGIPQSAPRDIVVEVTDGVRVLLLGRGESADVCRAVLAPNAALGTPNGDGFVLSTPDNWERAELKSYFDAAILADPDPLSPEQLAALESFVYAGGSVLLVPGPYTDPAYWNAQLFRDGAGLLPGQVAVQTRDTPELWPFPAPLAASAHVYRFVSVDPAPDAEVLARFASGQIAVVERPLRRGGGGRTALIAAGLDSRWSDAAELPAFAASLRELLRRIAPPPPEIRNPARGALLILSVPGNPAEADGTVTTPDGRTLPIAASPPPPDPVNRADFTLPTSQAGLHTARLRAGRTVRTLTYAVHPVSTDRLTSATPAQMQRTAAAMCARFESDPDAIPWPAPPAPGPRPLWPWLAAAAVLLLLAESHLSRRWSDPPSRSAP